MSRYIIILLIFLTQSFATDDLFFKANEMYESGDYLEASKLYDSLIEKGVTTAGVLANRAASAYRLGDIGRSVLFYERALLRDPRCMETARSLKFVRSQLADSYEEPEVHPLWRVARWIHHWISLPLQLILFSFLSFLIAFFLWIALFKSGNRRVWAIYSASSVFIMALVTALSIGMKIYALENIRYGVVLASEISAVSAPQGERVLFKLHEGTKVRVQEKRGNWLRIQTPSGIVGWIGAESFAVVD